jgi:hypothetical protein
MKGSGVYLRSVHTQRESQPSSAEISGASVKQEWVNESEMFYVFLSLSEMLHIFIIFIMNTDFPFHLHVGNFINIFFFSKVLGIKPRALHLLGRWSTIELQ